MAKPNPTYAPDFTSEILDYKPLSLLAVAGFVVAALYAGFVLVSAVVALFKGEPFLLGGWTIALACAGAALSGLGLWHISSSEGTRAGLLLAKWGMGISLVTGLAYFTYQSVTGWAVREQANAFLLGDSKTPGFLLRLPGSDRDRAAGALLYALGQNSDNIKEPWLHLRTKDNPKDPLTVFLESSLVRALRVADPGSVKIEPLAVQSWSYQGGSYHIARLYRVTTDEAVFEPKLTVSSIEPVAEGEKRRWKIEMQELIAPLQPVSRTELGDRRWSMRQQALEFLNDPKTGWFEKLKWGRSAELYLGTKPLALRKGLRERAEAIHARTPLVALAGCSLQSHVPKVEGALMSQLLPDFHPLGKLVEYFNLDKVAVWEGASVAKIQNAARVLFAPKMLPSLKAVPNDMAPCVVGGGEVLITYQAQAGVAVDDAVLLFEVVVAAPENMDPGAANSEQEWYLKSARLDRAIKFARGDADPSAKTANPR